MIAEARSQSKAIVTSAEDKAKRVEEDAERASKRTVEVAEHEADKSKDELKHELAQERKAEQQMRKVASADLKEQKKEATEGAKRAMQRAKDKSLLLAREAEQSIKQSKANEAQQESLDRNHAKLTLETMKDSAQKKVTFC